MPHIYYIKGPAEAQTIMHAAGTHDILYMRGLIAKSMKPSVNNPERFAMRMDEDQVLEEFRILRELARQTIRSADTRQRDISAASHHDMPAIRDSSGDTRYRAPGA